ncbi:inositol-3-phosphate synthase [Candidatus Micrarchaeota archaeon]|nr:inositol-3-phosphate synthase [Candidatus Micrarchaeota archaeon]MBU1166191.1 inositol-3-phosphate synthase [Candidatus Micrarchaeota archaeon]MBU1887122.1 inositol-3-phosphate synthase [Candidatus Micrarchaeota archaeon]
MGKIRCAVVGVGNCFAGLVQGIEYYKQHQEQKVIGIMHENMGGYSIHDIEFVAAFDVDSKKVGIPLNKAVYAEPNKVKWVETLSTMDEITVKQSPQLDGVGTYVEKVVTPVHERPTEELKKEILHELKEKKVEILVSYLPVGSDKATKFWAQVCLDTKIAFVNCMPSFIASEPEWAKKFEEAQIPIIGDDIKSQVGATIVHRTLARLCDMRGTKIDRTYQINVGGNTDFLTMKDQDRLQSKKISKTEAVQSQLSQRLPDDQIYVGPSDFIPFLSNTKLMFMRIEGHMWANIPYNMEVRLEVDDKANSAGIVIDAVRAAKISLDRKLGGPVWAASAYLMKHPPKQMTDNEAREELEKFIKG